jgi:probable rRNA maturation factor
MRESNTQTNSRRDRPTIAGSYCIELSNRHAVDFDFNRAECVVRRILQDHDWKEAEISVAIIDDAEIQSLNRRFLEHDYPTDVLTFPMDRDDQIGYLSGEVVVSHETAAVAAREQSVHRDDELMLYIIHGLLHLTGFDDKNAEGAKQIREAEKFYMELAGANYAVPPPPSSDPRDNAPE